MKEIRDIIKAYDEACLQNKQTALATVVHVEGSSYRRPGARMLITEDGLITGAISGGCLEGDAMRKAQLAIVQQKNKLVVYDTTDEDDAKFGVQLGCNGIVYILFEPLAGNSKALPIAILRRTIVERKNAVITTLFSLSEPEQTGTVEMLPSSNEHALSKAVAASFHSARSTVSEILIADKPASALLQFLPPEIHLVIAGGGNDAMPVVDIAAVLGWQTTVIDGRNTHATPTRFPKADRVVVANASTALSHVETDERTAFVLMTHNYNYDLELLANLSSSACSYIGILGPRKKYDRMMDELRAKKALLSADFVEKIHSPVGLDIGAETAEEIALSITSEIKAVLSGHSAKSLRGKTIAIHDTLS